MREDPFDVFMAAFAKAMSEAGPNEVSNALLERLLQKRDGYNSRTVLREIVDGAVKSLATEILTRIVQERAPEIEAQLREKIATMSFDVRMGDTIAVFPSLKEKD